MNQGVMTQKNERKNITDKKLMRVREAFKKKDKKS